MIQRLIRYCLFIFISTLAFPYIAKGQSSTVSPYSRYGIGELQNQVGVQGFSMGNTGNSMHNDSLTPFFVNLKNPASYYYNRITTFEAGILNNKVNFSSGDQKHSNDNAYFGYFTIAFPVTNWLGACLGLTPVSSLGYSINTTSALDSMGHSIDNVTNTYTGQGGINSVFLGLAISPDKYHHLSMGAHLSYLFGNITNEQNVDYPSNYSAFGLQRSQTAYVKDFYMNYGLMFTIGKPSGWNVTLGATLGLGKDLKTSYNLLSLNYLGGLVYDTIQDSNVSNGKIHLPVMIGGGITIKKGEKWTFNLDYSMQNWSQYSYLGQSQNLNNSTQYAFGVQYVPHKNFDAPHTYLQRIHYRAGFSYNQTYLDINNTALVDYCASFGLGLPIGPNYTLNRACVLNIGLQVGQLGTTTNNLLKEQYFKVLFGFTFADRWFVKRQFE